MKLSIRHNIRRFVAALFRAPGTVMAEIDQIVMASAIMVAREAKRGAPKALSTLVNSIANQRVSLAWHQVIAGADHAIHVERGTGPGGNPPIEALLRWIKQQGLQPTVARDQRSLAFLIQRKIRQRGTPAQPFMEPALEGHRARFLTMLSAAQTRGLQKAFR